MGGVGICAGVALRTTNCRQRSKENRHAGNIQVACRGVQVWDCQRNGYRRVLPILVVAYADTPARRGWLLSCGATCRSGCDKCGIRSTRTLPNGEKLSFSAFLGYEALTNGMVYDEADRVCTSLHRYLGKLFTFKGACMGLVQGPCAHMWCLLQCCSSCNVA